MGHSVRWNCPVVYVESQLTLVVVQSALCGCVQADLRKHVSRRHGDLAADQQQELLTLGKLSSAELAQNESLSAGSSNFTASTQPRQRPITYRQKRPRLKSTNFYEGSASCSAAVDFGDHEEQMIDYYKAEPVRVVCSDSLIITCILSCSAKSPLSVYFVHELSWISWKASQDSHVLYILLASRICDHK